MKNVFTIAVLCVMATSVSAQPTAVPASYSQIAADTRSISNEHDLMTRMRARPVILDLIPFGASSDAFYQRGKKADEIAFVCSGKYKGGPTQAVIVRSEAGGDGGRFYHLDNCKRK